MAHSIEKRAEALADLFGGMGYDEVAAKHKVARSTIQKWERDQQAVVAKSAEKSVKRKTRKTKTEIGTESVNRPILNLREQRQERFTRALESFLESALKMVQVWAETASDPEFVRSHTADAHELGKTVLERADKLVSLIGNDDEPN